MKRIDLRFLIVIGAFYAPGIAMLIGAIGLGYSLDEARLTISCFGFVIGLCAAIAAIAHGYDTGPIWWEFRK